MINNNRPKCSSYNKTHLELNQICSRTIISNSQPPKGSSLSESGVQKTDFRIKCFGPKFQQPSTIEPGRIYGSQLGILLTHCNGYAPTNNNSLPYDYPRWVPNTKILNFYIQLPHLSMHTHAHMICHNCNIIPLKIYQTHLSTGEISIISPWHLFGALSSCWPGEFTQTSGTGTFTAFYDRE